jgi:hypothetical protein
LPESRTVAAVKLDWGSVSAWLGAISIILAFRIFMRDRANTDRAQVNTTAVWWEVEAPFVQARGAASGTDQDPHVGPQRQ